MKYEKILNDTWEYLESRYKGSEITFGMWLLNIQKQSGTKNCLKQCIKLLWEQWEWYDIEEKEYYIELIKRRFGVKVG